MTGVQKRGSGRPWLAISLLGIIDLLILYGVTLMYAQGEIAFALIMLILAVSASWVFISHKAYCYRYVFPGLLGVAVFIVFPLLYTVNIAFTNFSSTNLLSQGRVKNILLAQRHTTGDSIYKFQMFEAIDKGGKTDKKYYLQLTAPDDQVYKTASFRQPTAPKVVKARLASADISTETGVSPLPLRDVIKNRDHLYNLTVKIPDGSQLVMTGIRRFEASSPLYVASDKDDTLVNTLTGETIYPDWETGRYTHDGSDQIGPGFVTYTGWQNFDDILNNPGIKGPFLKIFLWTVIFAGLSVLFTLIVGLLMACLIQWEPLKGNGIYRILLILPYAVPAFISILIFRGLFNQNFGEINVFLDILFGIKPEWFSNATLAKTMVLMVNTWLGYPYIMILSIGLLKAIPDTLYEASAIDGAGPWQNLTQITIPLILKPLMPLLIASFAFNFNNLVLIALLTDGGPDLLGATTPAGATDILVSYTFRLAFGSYGQDYGLASAIATIIFLIVGVIAWLNLQATKKYQSV
ncbi:maltose ABC transporter permease MalF [Sansalvadorimonas verongulae]|uniref:maltose ABC transporter permease MalF n=1 Tax=Sansalvadorimonas verongulae TaxID=2172824 RepID=UPI0012BC8C8A|nr:maltose ABC transporter permease MalF [Sansalvadorimonas verongulae]MTI13925.1 maltose ABC transporter permease MalF [Sansalvadorimonas verongulae]